MITKAQYFDVRVFGSLDERLFKISTQSDKDQAPFKMLIFKANKKDWANGIVYDEINKFCHVNHCDIPIENILVDYY